MCSCLQEIKAVGAELAITPVIIRGEELKDKGFGGTAFGFQFHCVSHPFFNNNAIKLFHGQTKCCLKKH